MRQFMLVNRLLKTEERNERTKDLDLLSSAEIIRIMNEEDMNAVLAVKEVFPQIEAVIQAMSITLKNKGRIIYTGAGTSGRMGILDAVECGPTFGCTDEFKGLIAGGYDAIVKAAEGAEDNRDLGVQDLKNIALSANDMVIGIAASGTTPYVIAGMEYAKQIGAKTACVCCNTSTPIGGVADYPIEVNPGSEILTGSTRLKSGTCQKMILNMLSTASMVSMGKVYGNLMVDVRATNRKLKERCRRIVMEATGCGYETADQTLIKTDNDCKTAIVMILLDTDKETAEKKLAQAGGFVRKAIGSNHPK